MTQTPTLPTDETTRETTREAAQRVAQQLNESNVGLVLRVIEVLGLTRTEALLQQTLAIEANGGLLTLNRRRRRTPGGVFFKLAKDQATLPERRAIFPLYISPRRTTWQEVVAAAQQVIQCAEPGRTESMRTIVTGIPRQVTQMEHCVAVALIDTPARDVPRELPRPPHEMKHRVVVFIVHKQWERIKHRAEQGLHASGVLLPDPKNNLSILLAQEVKAVSLQTAEKNEAETSAEEPSL